LETDVKTPTVEDAICLAAAAHAGHVDKAGAPYIFHPLRLMLRMETEAEHMVAVLHDLIEDTPHTFEELRALGYPADVLCALDCVTRRETESYEEFILRIAPNPLARKVKIADLEDNLDLSRIAHPTEKDYRRLERYRAALAVLQAG
jgi:(p)ppGpp synthase/HD superfamily hydrolase